MRKYFIVINLIIIMCICGCTTSSPQIEESNDSSTSFMTVNDIRYKESRNSEKISQLLKQAKEISENAEEKIELVEELQQQQNEEFQEPQESVENIDSQQDVYENNYDYNNYSYDNVNINNNGSGLTQQSGVNYYDGRTETYYSSNVLYHYRTSEWTVDNEGFYRTNEGYYVVAASDMPQGTTFEGSKGICIVLDSGCNAGVTDYYVNW